MMNTARATRAARKRAPAANRLPSPDPLLMAYATNRIVRQYGVSAPMARDRGRVGQHQPGGPPMSAPNLFTVAAQRTSSTPRPSTAKRGRRIAFNVTEGEDVRTITPAGRDAWALGELILPAPLAARRSQRRAAMERLRLQVEAHLSASTSKPSPRCTAASMPASTLDTCCARALPSQIPRTPLAMGAANERRDDFDWGEGNGDVVLRAYGSVAVHENPYGDVVVRQERDALEEDDHWVVIPVQDAELRRTGHRREGEGNQIPLDS